MDRDDQRTTADSGAVVLAYRRFVVLGLLAISGALLQQFLNLNRGYLSALPTERDPGLTLPGMDVPTTLFVACALAVAIPCLSILGANYGFAAPEARLPAWLERVLWTVGVASAGLALTATFWFINQLAAALFLASSCLSYVLYSASIRVIRRRIRRGLKHGRQG